MGSYNGKCLSSLRIALPMSKYSGKQEFKPLASQASAINTGSVRQSWSFYSLRNMSLFSQRKNTPTGKPEWTPLWATIPRMLSGAVGDPGSSPCSARFSPRISAGLSNNPCECSWWPNYCSGLPLSDGFHPWAEKRFLSFPLLKQASSPQNVSILMNQHHPTTQ